MTVSVGRKKDNGKIIIIIIGFTLRLSCFPFIGKGWSKSSASSFVKAGILKNWHENTSDFHRNIHGQSYIFIFVSDIRKK